MKLPVHRLTAILVLFGLTLAGCGDRHGPIGAGMAAFIPPDTAALAGVNVDRLRATPLYRKLAAAKRIPDFGDFRVEDVHELVLATDGDHVLAIARGTFPAGAQGITLAGNNTALAGSDAMVRAALAQAKSGGRGAPRDLMARAATVPADAQIWAVVAGWHGAGPGAMRALGNAANMDRVLRAFEGATLTAGLDAGAHAALTGECRTEADAASLADSLRGLASLARLGVPRNQTDLLRAFDQIQVRQQGRLVNLNIDVPQELANALADSLADKPRPGR